MFDCFACWGDPMDATMAVALSRTGYDLRVSLALAEPPDVSYVHAGWLSPDGAPQWQAEYDDPHEMPYVLSADGNLLLLRAPSPPADGIQIPPSYREDYYVYKADPLRPSLNRLPTFTPLVLGDSTGIVCRGGGGADYAVATLGVRILKEGDTYRQETEIIWFSSVTEEWEIKQLPMPHDRERGIDLFLSETDATIAFNGLLCWIDYCRGILLCDLFDEFPVLRYIQLPVAPWNDFLDNRGVPAAFRSVCVSKGVMWFVDIDNGFFGAPGRDSGFTITTWSLRQISGGGDGDSEPDWERGNTIQVDDLWALEAYQNKHVPRQSPMFAVVSKQDPIILYCMVQESVCSKAWRVTLDMTWKTPPSFSLRINAEKDPEHRNFFYYIPFVCSELSTDLNVHVIKTHVIGTGVIEDVVD